nr:MULTISPECIES: ABC transporter transmembrane domain-containing protein [Lactobacillus]
MKFKFFQYLYPHKKLLWLGIIIASGLTSLDGIASPYIIGTLTNVLMAKKFNKVPQILILYLVLFLIITISYWLWQLLWARARRAANLKMREDVFNHFLDSPSPERIEKVNNFVNVDVKQIEGSYVNSVVNLVYCIEQAVFSLIYVISINGIVSMAFLICGLLPSLVPRLTGKWVEKGSEEWNKSYEEYNLTLN